MQRVAVIGAGVAGLTVARRLEAEPDLEVHVFDKARGAGGRVSTRRDDERAFDHGAQYFTCRSPRFEPVVKDWLSRGVVAEWSARVVHLDHGRVGDDPGGDPRYVGHEPRELEHRIGVRTRVEAVQMPE